MSLINADIYVKRYQVVLD